MVTSKFACLLLAGVADAAVDHHHNWHAATSLLSTEETVVEKSLVTWDHKYAEPVKSFVKVALPIPPSWWDQSSRVWLDKSHLLQQPPTPEDNPIVAEGANDPRPPEMVSQAAGKEKAQIVWTMFWDSVITILIVATVAAFYMHFKKPNFEKDLESSQPSEAFTVWRYEWYWCFPENNADTKACLSACVCAFLCPCIRWSETLSRVKPFHNFWLLFAAYSGCWILSRLGWFSLFGVLMLIALNVFFRRELRREYGMKQGVDTMCFDCLLYTFCGCCTILQEARHVERSMKTLHCAVYPPPTN